MIDFLRSLKLSLIEWLALAGAAISSALVVALKLQGSRLHKAQVDLLKQKFEAKEELIDGKCKNSRAKYSKALRAYTKAGGRV